MIFTTDTKNENDFNLSVSVYLDDDIWKAIERLFNAIIQSKISNKADDNLHKIEWSAEFKLESVLCVCMFAIYYQLKWIKCTWCVHVHGFNLMDEMKSPSLLYQI